jgi:hypothetical protein
VNLTFKTTVTVFRDPDDNNEPNPLGLGPQGAFADNDHDGIRDREEALLAAYGAPVGDPTRRDLLLAVAHTDPVWALTPMSRRLLMSRFREHGIDLYIASEGNNAITMLIPGHAISGGAYTASSFHPTIANVTNTICFNHVIGFMTNITHFVLLAEEIVGADWGLSSGVPGRNLMIRSHLPTGLGADVNGYQVKCLMHELGHNLGLCHPTLTCPSSGTLPVAERDPALTSMGSPAEASTPADMIADALLRPLDYTPTQWINLMLPSVRTSH